MSLQSSNRLLRKWQQKQSLCGIDGGGKIVSLVSSQRFLGKHEHEWCRIYQCCYGNRNRNRGFCAKPNRNRNRGFRHQNRTETDRKWKIQNRNNSRTYIHIPIMSAGSLRRPSGVWAWRMLRSETSARWQSTGCVDWVSRSSSNTLHTPRLTIYNSNNMK